MAMNAPLKRLSHSSSHSIAPRSRWLVGSSSSSTSGFCASARAIAARRRSPPLAVAAGRDKVDPELVGDRRRLVRARARPGRAGPNRASVSKPVHRRVLLEQDDIRPRNDRALALVRVDQPGEALEQGRLAGAVAADQRQPVALADVQVELAEQPAFALDQPKVFVGEDRRGHAAQLTSVRRKPKPVS